MDLKFEQNVCVDLESRDVTAGIPIDPYPPEIQWLDVNGDRFIQGLKEIELLNLLVQEHRNHPLPEDVALEEAFLSLDRVVPRIEEDGTEPGEYSISLYGTDVKVKNPGGGTIDPLFLSQIAGAVQMLPQGLWRDLVQNGRPAFFVGSREDLIRYFEEGADENRRISRTLRQTNHTAFTAHVFTIPFDPEKFREQIILTESPMNGSRRLKGMKRFGCAQEDLYVDRLFHVVLHELGHALDGALGKEMGIMTPLSLHESSLASVLIEEQQGRHQVCDSRFNQMEYLVESSIRTLLCRQLSKTDFYLDVHSLHRPPVYETYEPPLIDQDLWNGLMNSMELFLTREFLDPSPLVVFPSP